MTGGDGADYLLGEAGNDTFKVKDPNSPVRDTVAGGDGYDTCLLIDRDNSLDILFSIENY